MNNDAILNPAHYAAYPVRPIEISRHLGFCLGNVVKYVLRAPYKGGVEDVNKALKYLDWEKESPRAIVHHEALAAIAKLDKLSDWLHGAPGAPDMQAVTECQADFLDFLQGYLEEGGAIELDFVRFYTNRLAEILADKAKEEAR